MSMERQEVLKDDTPPPSQDLFVTDHTQSMRKACQYCIDLYNHHFATTDLSSTTTTTTISSQKEPEPELEEEHDTTDTIPAAGSAASTLTIGDHISSSPSSLPHPSSIRTIALWKSISQKSVEENQESFLQQRQDAQHDFWQCSTTHLNNNNPQQQSPGTYTKFPTFHYCCDDGNGSDEKYKEESSVIEFHQNYQRLNLPCLISGLDQTYFDTVNKLWRKTTQWSSSPLSDDNETKIHREWFLEHLGPDCQVPLRYTVLSSPHNHNDNHDSAIDDDGRAVECQTKNTTMKDWIDMMITTTTMTTNDVNEIRHHHHKDDDDEKHSVYYLKDWHFQQLYETTMVSNCSKSCQRDDDHDDDGDSRQRHNDKVIEISTSSLYTIPPIFQPDLLNRFLMKFTKGDYRFLYWGPTSSYTGRHSDVLHSFSWSYNVVGTKEWTFYPPPCSRTQSKPSTKDKEIDNQQSQHCSSSSHMEPITIRQEAGQSIFVPATWQHEVINLEETISLNHNWISTCNIDLCWDCLVIEMDAIQTELHGWWTDEMISNNVLDFVETKENMLRGCVGLDVSSFFLMTLLGLLDTLIQIKTREEGCVMPSSSIPSHQHERDVFDLHRLLSIFQQVIKLDETEQQGAIETRLRAVVQSENLVREVMGVATDILDSLASS